MDVQSRRDGRGLYEFAQFMLDVPQRDLLCGVQRIHLAPKTFEVLVALVTRPHRLVTKREILECVWPEVFVAEGILTAQEAFMRSRRSDFSSGHQI